VSVLRTGCLYHPGHIPGTHFCWRLSRTSRAIERPEGSSPRKISVTSPRIEPATFGLVAKLRHRLPQEREFQNTIGARPVPKLPNSSVCSKVELIYSAASAPKNFELDLVKFEEKISLVLVSCVWFSINTPCSTRCSAGRRD
jgi:hypothetical protein